MSPYIIEVLARIINLDIEMSIWPDNLKTSKVPIYKSGDKYDVRI